MTDPGTPRILIVDDERALAGIIASYLDRAGFATSLAHTGPDAVAVARSLGPDVIILDLGLPGLDGIEVCREIRSFSDCYILMLTARADEVDKLVGLSVGADDYVTKPFSPRELVARVNAVLRRPRRSTSSAAQPPRTKQFGALIIDQDGREVWLDGAEVPLTRTEFDIVEALATHPHLAMSRRQIIDEVWGPSWIGDEHVVDVHVANLRKKLADPPGEPRYILTVRGVGYRMGPG